MRLSGKSAGTRRRGAEPAAPVPSRSSAGLAGYRRVFRPLSYRLSAMPRRRRDMQSVNTELPKGRKSTQRERLVAGVVAVANRDGYAGANIAALIAEAGVSRPTFYDYFADRDECFVAAFQNAHEALAGEIRRAVERTGTKRPAGAAIGALVEFASARPAMAR